MNQRRHPPCIALRIPPVGTAAWAALQSFHEGAVAALLRHRASGRLVLAASTHLHWDPQNPHIKLLQAALLSHALARIAGEGVATATGTSSSRGSKDRDASCTILGSMEGQIHGSEVLLVLGGDFNSIAQKYLPDRFDPEVRKLVACKHHALLLMAWTAVLLYGAGVSNGSRVSTGTYMCVRACAIASDIQPTQAVQ